MLDPSADLAQLYRSLLTVLTAYVDLLLVVGIPAPVGLIGAWRWGVWLLRRSIGLFYRPQTTLGYLPTTTVVTPVYNETPAVFREALRSWAANGPMEIIAVIDHSDERCIQEFKDFTAACEADGAITPKLIITTTPGKRPALVDGMLAATGEIVFLVDSDTIWATDVLIKAVAPFADPRVGGVTTRQNVLAPQSMAQRLFDVYLDIRYSDEIRFLTAFGDAVTCLSGRTAVYRRAAVLPLLDDLLNETFLGKRVISGDDKALTLLVQSRGWKVRYQANARVYTPGAGEMGVFLKQRLRWARNSWRADLKALCSSWVWHKPFLVFHLLDRLLQPLTTLVAPFYVCFTIYQQHWLALAVILSWWGLSRSIKIWPHLSRRRSNIIILPGYILFSYWSAVLKIYAFFTMNQQGWITRWNQNRMAILGPMRWIPGYLATAVTVTAVAIPIFYESLRAQTPAKIIASDRTMVLAKFRQHDQAQPGRSAVTIASAVSGFSPAEAQVILPAAKGKSPTPNHSPTITSTNPRPVSPAGPATPTPAPTATPLPAPEPLVQTFAGTPSYFTLVTIPESYHVNARYTQNTTSPVLMLLPSGMTLTAIGRSADTTWLQVILPDQRLAWIFTNLVRTNVEYVQALPITTAP